MIGNADFLATIARSRQSELIADADRHRILGLARRYRRQSRTAAAQHEALRPHPAVSSPRAKHA